ARSVKVDVDAVGLFRSEFLELARRSFPTEEEQYAVYSKMLRILDGRPLTLRTLDLRADKLFGLASLHSDQSWEWRLVDQLPHVQELVRTQLRAVLRAAVEGPVRVLFPMVMRQRQFDCALRLVDEARRTLLEEGLPFRGDVPIGVMIEVPAAASLVRRWAPRVDFFSIGSNDLLHSLLGIDRGDDALRTLKTPLDPSYLRTVRRVVKHASAAGRPVTVCGDAASNGLGMLALYCLGVTALSMPPDDVVRARRYFSRVDWPVDPTAVGRRLLRAADAEEVEELLLAYFPPRSSPNTAKPAPNYIEAWRPTVNL
ncbi:MAG: putative PEP-binding protein, partial [Planctomycetia bacterium]